MGTFKFIREEKADSWKSKCDFIKFIDFKENLNIVSKEFQTENNKWNRGKTTLCPVLWNYFIIKRNHNFLSQGQKLDLKSVDPPQTVSSLCIRMQVLNKKSKRLFSKTFYFVRTAEFESNKVNYKRKDYPTKKLLS